jgi:hypothetical protein
MIAEMMGGRAILICLLGLAWGPQENPLEGARRELGSGFAVELLRPNLVFATDGVPGDRDRERRILSGLAGAIQDRALGTPPGRPIRLTVLGSDKAFQDVVRTRYPRATPPGYADRENRLLFVRSSALLSFLPRVLSSLWLHDNLESRVVTDWLVSGMGAFATHLASPPAVDLGASRLKAELARSELPTLGRLLGLSPADFRRAERYPLHEAQSAHFLLFLDQKKMLRRFFECLRKTVDQDPTGVVAAAKAFDSGLPPIEREFVEYVRALPWVNRARLAEEARERFGPDAPARAVDELELAAMGNAEAAMLERCLGNVRALRGALGQRLGMSRPHPPVEALVFRDTESFRAYLESHYPEKPAIAGYYDRVNRRILADMGCGIPVFTHEYCHSLFEDDIGLLAPWVNEGLPCLFENFRLEGGSVVGEGDGRLALVRRPVQTGRAPALGRFLELGATEFYGSERSFNFMMASAFCLYLEDRGKLNRFYADLRTPHADDPSCVRTLEASTGMVLGKIEEDFRAWIALPRDR